MPRHVMYDMRSKLMRTAHPDRLGSPLLHSSSSSSGGTISRCAGFQGSYGPEYVIGHQNNGSPGRHNPCMNGEHNFNPQTYRQDKNQMVFPQGHQHRSSESTVHARLPTLLYSSPSPPSTLLVITSAPFRSIFRPIASGFGGAIKSFPFFSLFISPNRGKRGEDQQPGRTNDDDLPSHKMDEMNFFASKIYYISHMLAFIQSFLYSCSSLYPVLRSCRKIQSPLYSFCPCVCPVWPGLPFHLRSTQYPLPISWSPPPFFFFFCTFVIFRY